MRGSRREGDQPRDQRAAARGFREQQWVFEEIFALARTGPVIGLPEGLSTGDLERVGNAFAGLSEQVVYIDPVRDGEPPEVRHLAPRRWPRKVETATSHLDRRLKEIEGDIEDAIEVMAEPPAGVESDRPHDWDDPLEDLEAYLDALRREWSYCLEHWLCAVERERRRTR